MSLHELIENHMLIRRVLVALNVVFIGAVTWWSAWFASHHPVELDGVGVGAIIAAVQVPCSMLTGKVFDLYNQSRKENGNG